MAYQRLLDTGLTPTPRQHWIGITGPAISGYFAVEYWLNPDMGGFPEPWDTGVGRYSTAREAAEEAVMLADEMELPCVLSKALWEQLVADGLVQEVPHG